MGFFDSKPRSVTIDLSRMKVNDLEYYCTAKHIDKEVARLRNLPFDQAKADDMDLHSRYYFVVKTNREYDVIKGPEFEKWLAKNFDPILTVSGEIENWNPKTETGNIVVDMGDAEVSYIQIEQMKMTAKAKVCRDHLILIAHGLKVK